MWTWEVGASDGSASSSIAFGISIFKTSGIFFKKKKQLQQTV
jgi:hypothetical protein